MSPSSQNSRENNREKSAESISIKSIIVDGNVSELVTTADQLGEKLAGEGLSTSQMRNVFGRVRQIEMNWNQNPDGSYRQAILLKPKLAYFAKRDAKMGPLERVLAPALDLVQEAGQDQEERHRRFLRFTEFFEAILAYHKKYGGKD